MSQILCQMETTLTNSIAENMELSKVGETFETVPTRRGRDKFIIRGYLMGKNKSIKTTYYWWCREGKWPSCKGRAVTRLTDTGKHVLLKVVDHNHPPNAPNKIKLHTNNSSTQQSRISSVPSKLTPSLPSKGTIRPQITEIRRSQRRSGIRIVKKEVLFYFTFFCRGLIIFSND